MKLLTKAIKAKLLANSAASAAADGGIDHKPVLKLFNPTGAATWLISEMDENEIMFGLADLGLGFAELGTVDFNELAEYRGMFGLGIERDLGFKADKTLGEYADEARALGRIAV